MRIETLLSSAAGQAAGAGLNYSRNPSRLFREFEESASSPGALDGPMEERETPHQVHEGKGKPLPKRGGKDEGKAVKCPEVIQKVGKGDKARNNRHRGWELGHRIVDPAQEQHNADQRPGCHLCPGAKRENQSARKDPRQRAVQEQPKNEHREGKGARIEEVKVERIVAEDAYKSQDYTPPHNPHEPATRDKMPAVDRRHELVLDTLRPHVKEKAVGHIQLTHLDHTQGDHAD